MARKDDLLVPLMLGTANVSLKEKDIATVTIPVPAIAIQQRIVARIDAIAAKVEAARQLRGKVEDEAAAYVVSLHSKLAGERTKALGEILVLDEDAKTVSPDSSYPQVGVRSFGAGLFRKGAVEGFETTYRAFNRLYSGAVVLSQVKGWEGAIAVCPADLEGWYVSPEYRTFRCRPTEALPEYLAALLPTEWFWSHLGAATRGVGARRERTRPEQFLQLRIPMPNITAQEFAARTFAQLGALCDFQNQALSELDAIMPAVLDRAFKGRAAGSAIVETMTDAEALE
jgi:type I restriction enzyme S subunit